MKIAALWLSAFLMASPVGPKSYLGYSKLPPPPATSKGESIYRESDCSMCHGELGDGEGFLAEGLIPKPRDFTSFNQMINVPDLQMANAIRNGIKGTGMPAHPAFNDEQIDELIFYLRSLLASTYLTVNLCMTDTHEVDIGGSGLNLPDFSMVVDDPQLITVKKEKKRLAISANNTFESIKALLQKKVIRSHIKLIEKDHTVSIIAVRLHRCVH